MAILGFQNERLGDVKPSAKDDPGDSLGGEPAAAKGRDELHETVEMRVVLVEMDFVAKDRALRDGGRVFQGWHGGNFLCGPGRGSRVGEMRISDFGFRIAEWASGPGLRAGMAGTRLQACHV